MLITKIFWVIRFLWILWNSNNRICKIQDIKQAHILYKILIISFSVTNLQNLAYYFINTKHFFRNLPIFAVITHRQLKTSFNNEVPGFRFHKIYKYN